MPKNKSLFFSSLLLLVISASAQEQIHFKIGYQPGKRYHQLCDGDQLVTLLFLGPPDLLKEMKYNGDSISKKVVQKMHFDADMETSKTVNDKGEFNFELIFNQLKIGSDSVSIPPRTKFIGVANGNDMPRFDSVISNEIGDEVKKQIIPLIQKMYSQITFPEKDLKKGESFTHEIPMQMPVGAAVIAVKILTRYTLMSVNNGMATLAISQTYTFDSGESKSITGSGDGNGELLYDIQNNFYRKFQINSALKLHLKTDRAEAREEIRGYYEQTSTINSL